jgi:hypothetical protein
MLPPVPTYSSLLDAATFTHRPRLTLLVLLVWLLLLLLLLLVEVVLLLLLNLRRSTDASAAVTEQSARGHAPGVTRLLRSRLRKLLLVLLPVVVVLLPVMLMTFVGSCRKMSV